MLFALAAPLSQAVIRDVSAVPGAVGAASAPRAQTRMDALYVGPEAQTEGVALYLSEPPDAQREVVIFVHGANGGPGDFRHWIAALDHSQFQVWVADYPSSLAIATAGDILAEKVTRLAQAYQLSRFAVVGHSLGGLVAWRLAHTLLGHFEAVTLTTVATPFNGHRMARWGALLSPSPQPVWLDLVPGSAALHEIWEDTVRPHHTLIAVEQGDARSSLGDGTIALESQLPAAMASQAKQVVHWQGTHVGVLEDPACAQAIAGLLDTASHP